MKTADVRSIIADALQVSVLSIMDITVLKQGMTNRSFRFSCEGQKYILRIPGEGTNRLINREQEAEVYGVIAGKGICEDIVYLNPYNGIKIARYYETAKVCRRDDVQDLKVCMKKLREFHDLKLAVGHSFSIFEQIAFYESLWGGCSSCYGDYLQTKENVFSLREYIESHVESRCLAHIDAVPDNFLFVQEGDVRLIDWEYAGMQDPHVDIAMFGIYALYDRQQMDGLINMYFEGTCSEKIRLKIYCYVAVCGLLWSNWCEYKKRFGITFGEYALKQYQYARDYYEIVRKKLM